MIPKHVATVYVKEKRFAVAKKEKKPAVVRDLPARTISAARMEMNAMGSAVAKAKSAPTELAVRQERRNAAGCAVPRVKSVPTEFAVRQECRNATGCAVPRVKSAPTEFAVRQECQNATGRVAKMRQISA